MSMRDCPSTDEQATSAMVKPMKTMGRIDDSGLFLRPLLPFPCSSALYFFFCKRFFRCAEQHANGVIEAGGFRFACDVRRGVWLHLVRLLRRTQEVVILLLDLYRNSLKLEELFHRESRLFDDRRQRPALKIPAMPRQRHAQAWVFLIFQNVVTACYMVDHKSGADKRTQHVLRLEKGRCRLMPVRTTERSLPRSGAHGRAESAGDLCTGFPGIHGSHPAPSRGLPQACRPL